MDQTIYPSNELGIRYSIESILRSENPYTEGREHKPERDSNKSSTISMFPSSLRV